MSAIVVLTPLVVSSWPAFSCAILGVAGALGYNLSKKQESGQKVKESKSVIVQVKNSEVISETLQADQQITVEKDGVIVSFSRGLDHRCNITVHGTEQSDSELREIGQQIARKVTQRFVYNKVVSELKALDFDIVDEEVEAQDTIRLQVRKLVY